MKRISFGMTLEQFEDGSKDVTRRLGWQDLQAGQLLLAVDRVMGFKKGEKATVLGTIEILDARRERLDAITDEDVVREGFPGKGRAWFVEMFRKAMRCQDETQVTRIEFRRLDAPLRCRKDLTVPWRSACLTVGTCQHDRRCVNGPRPEAAPKGRPVGLQCTKCEQVHPLSGRKRCIRCRCKLEVIYRQPAPRGAR